MPLNRLLSLCERISKEHDSSKMNLLLKELEVLLREEQEGIRNNIQERLKVRAD